MAIKKSKLSLLQMNFRNIHITEAVVNKNISVKISDSQGKGVKQTIFPKTYFRNITDGNSTERPY